MKDKRASQLGMNPSTASNRLVKDILWDFIQKSDKNSCFHCGEEMQRENFSIEHKTPWLDSKEPLKMFFDLDNISFSHLSCNTSQARRLPRSPDTVCGTMAKYGTGCRCELCKKAKKDYAKSKYTVEDRAERYKRTGK